MRAHLPAANRFLAGHWLAISPPGRGEQEARKSNTDTKDICEPVENIRHPPNKTLRVLIERTKQAQPDKQVAFPVLYGHHAIDRKRE